MFQKMLYCDAEGRISENPPQLSFLDHGFLFGDSIYEVVRAYGGKILGWKDHMERFIASCQRISLDADPLMPVIEERALKTLRTLGEGDAALRIILSRGVGKLHIDPRTALKPTLWMAAWKIETEAQPTSLRLAIPQVRRLSISSVDPAIKSGNYLNSVMAFKEAVDLGYDDAVMLNAEGDVTELTTSNIAWLKGEKVFTPSTDCGILHGITRKLFLQSSKNIIEGKFSSSDLAQADEVFALSTFKEILPVVEIRLADGQVKKYTSTEKTRALHSQLKREIQTRLEKEKSFLV